MKGIDFLKDKILASSLLVFSIFTIEIFLLVYPVDTFIRIYMPMSILGAYGISIGIEYVTKNRYYQHMYHILEELEDKYFLTELIGQPNFTEGKILKDILQQTDKTMLEHVNAYKYLQEDYKEYIEMWIHEIKIPIATSKMIIENNKTDVTKRIEEELNKIENFTEQALYYARSNTVEKDYYIKKSNLQDMVNEVIRKNKTVFIGEKISLQVQDLQVEVKTDSKWVSFIVNQIIQNSIQYRKKEDTSKIEIYAKPGKENVRLYIKDNGIGIPEGEISRVFEKGFTGTNGRRTSKKSTGIGLYLCKKLCDKLGMAIKVSSVQGEGCEVQLVFPNSSYMELT